MPINLFGAITSLQPYQTKGDENNGFHKNNVKHSGFKHNTAQQYLPASSSAQQAASGERLTDSRLIKSHADSQLPLMDIFDQMKKAQKNLYMEKSVKEKSEQGEPAEEDSSKTDADIIVKPDGSRVLVVTTEIGGTTATMSIEISKPTDMQNECQQIDEEHPNDGHPDDDASNTSPLDSSNPDSLNPIQDIK